MDVFHGFWDVFLMELDEICISMTLHILPLPSQDAGELSCVMMNSQNPSEKHPYPTETHIACLTGTSQYS